MIVKPDYCPEWFDITLYDELKNYSRDNLSLALFVRILHYKNVLIELENISKEDRENWQNYAIEWVKYAANNWLVSPIKTKDTLQKETYDPLKADPDIIQEVTLSEIGAIYADCYCNIPEMRKLFQEATPELDKAIKEFDLSSYRSEAYAYLTDWLPDDKYSNDERKSFEDFLDCPITKKLNIEHLFRIDFSQSDEMLKMAFDKKLKEIRAKEQDKEKRTKRFSDAEIKKIIEYRVLAYIDLYIFGKIIDRKFTDVEMAAMIYPPTNNTPLNFDAVDRIARTVRPKAIELLEKTNTRLLL